MKMLNLESVRSSLIVSLFLILSHCSVGYSWSGMSRLHFNRRPMLSTVPTSIARQSSYSSYRVQSSTTLHADPLDIMLTMYKESLNTHPLETKVITGGVLAFLGDAIAQSKEPKYDEKRALSFVSFDAMYRAVQCYLFPEITRVFDGHYLATLIHNVDLKTLATMEQTIVNQFIVVPFIYYPFFFSFTGYLQGLPLDATIERAKTTLFPLLRRNWLFWIPVQYFQFGYVEESLQIPFLCVAGLAWTFILSSFAGSAVQATQIVNDDDDLISELVEADTYSTMKKEF